MLAGINSWANIKMLENLPMCIFQECALFPLVPTSLACSPESFESGGGGELLLSRFHLKQSPAQPPNPSSLSENCSVISAVTQFGIYHGLLQFATFIFFTQPSQRWRVERWRWRGRDFISKQSPPAQPPNPSSSSFITGLFGAPW